MKCPTIDKLSQYVDDRLAHDDVAMHVKDCAECQRVVKAFEGEQRFIKETLQTPTLPDDFASLVLDQLEPYEQQVKHEKRAPWKRILLSAAGVVLALGVSATLSPSLAEWIGGLFSTNQVDEGLRMARDAGLAERVDLEVMDNGITLKVEDVIVDSSRVALSYEILNNNGKLQNPFLDLADSKNEIMVMDIDGIKLDRIGISWQKSGDYGLIEFPLIEQDALEKITVKFDLIELNGVKGNWELEVPVDLTKNRDLTTTVPLQDATTNRQGVTIKMREIKFAPSSTDLSYETGFTKEEQADMEEQIRGLETQFGEAIARSATSYGTDIHYHVENEVKKTVYQLNSYFKNYSGMIGTSGTDMGHLSNAWNASFTPQKEESRLTFVLDGVIKTVPSDFSITIKPKGLKNHPVLFDYEGNFMTIKKVEKHSEYSFRKSVLPVEKETSLIIEMKGGKETSASELGSWVLVDDKGKAYATSQSGSSLDEKDKNGRYKTFMDLEVYDLDEVPEELTLHLVSVTRYEEVKEKWAVPLY